MTAAGGAPYAAPVRDMMFVLEELVGLEELAALPGAEEVEPALVRAVLDEAGRFAGEALAPLNRGGDLAGCRLENGVVATAPGFRDAYRAFVEAGWNGITAPAAHGGQGLPLALGACVDEMWSGACLAFSLCPLLTQAGIELLARFGDEEMRRTYLPRLVSGELTGTMLLTEPQAGSDLGQIRTTARRDGARWRLSGQKIFSTWGEHDLAENIVHLVLSRTEGAPPGTRGLSLFLVPKHLPGANGAPGPRNDIRCAALEHKLGLHASPTAVMALGDDEGALGWLIGAEGQGLPLMFTMMNKARLGVGIEGVGIAERATQQAHAYARERLQGRDLSGGDGPVAIIRHPDVRRMLMTMRAQTEAARALALTSAAALDRARRHPDPAERAGAQARVDLLIPVVKAWATDLAVETASLGLQVHGGMGYIEETGAAQHLRDARVTPIYEGTNGIQALDLVRRKLPAEGGAPVRALVGELRATASGLAASADAALVVIGRALAEGVEALAAATDWIGAQAETSPRDAAAGASPYLRLFGTVCGGALMARAAAAAHRLREDGGGDPFLETKAATARFYAETVLPQASALARAATAGAAILTAFEGDAP